MTHTLGDREYRGRHDIATNSEQGAILTYLAERISDIETNLSEQFWNVLRSLSPETFPEICSLPAGSTRDFPVGVAGAAVLQKITLVKINPGNFPSSISFRHDDMSGTFVLDSQQTTIEVDITQNGRKVFHATNNDAAIDCAVILAYKRIE